MRKAHGDKGGLELGRDALSIEAATGDWEKAKPFAQAIVEPDNRPVFGLTGGRVPRRDHSTSRTIITRHDSPWLQPKKLALADDGAAPHNMTCGKDVAAIDQEAAAVGEPFTADDPDWPIGCSVRPTIVPLEN